MSKEATRELAKLVRSRLGLELPDDAPLAKLRAITLRYVLAGEFRLRPVAARRPRRSTAFRARRRRTTSPRCASSRGAAHELRRRVRRRSRIASRTSSASRTPTAAAERARARSTHSASRSARCSRHCGDLIASGKFDEALALVAEREHSFWLDRDVARKAQWEACRRMAELGSVARRGARGGQQGRAAMPTPGSTPTRRKDGWYRLDQAQRRLETWVANLDDEPEERPLGVVRRAYEDACQAMADGFTKALVQGELDRRRRHCTRRASTARSSPSGRSRSPISSSMRCASRWASSSPSGCPKTSEVIVRPAVGALPSITPIGMAALQPGASASFSVVEQGGKLGARIDDAFLPDLAARKKFAAARVPEARRHHARRAAEPAAVEARQEDRRRQVVIVRSQEIDHAGEAGFTFQARQVMDTVIDNLARAIRKLAAAGVEHAVVTADHGHLFFAADRDESMRIDAPGGDTSSCTAAAGSAAAARRRRLRPRVGVGARLRLRPRFRVSRWAAASSRPAATSRSTTAARRCRSWSSRCSRSALKAREPVAPTAGRRHGDGPARRGHQPHLQRDASARRAEPVAVLERRCVVRPLLMSAGKQVGGVGMAIDAELDRATGCVTLRAGQARHGRVPA